MIRSILFRTFPIANFLKELRGRIVAGCDHGHRVGDLFRLTTQQILELKGKQNKNLRVKEHKKSATCISRIASIRSMTMPKRSRLSLFIPLKERRTSIPTQAYSHLNKAAEFAGEHLQPYLTENVWPLFLKNHEGYRIRYK